MKPERRGLSRGLVKVHEPSSPVVTYDVPWMWSWCRIYPSEWLDYPTEDLALDRRASLTTRRAERASEPEAWVARTRRGGMKRKLGSLLTGDEGDR